MAWKKRVHKRSTRCGVTEWWVEPDPDCRYCGGTGLTSQWEDYGSTVAELVMTCDCILDVLPKTFNDKKDKINIWRDQ